MTVTKTLKEEFVRLEREDRKKNRMVKREKE